jgi:hypothetical protein
LFRPSEINLENNVVRIEKEAEIIPDFQNEIENFKNNP